MAVNLLLQFLYHELRDTEKVRNWFRKKLSVEFEQLLSSSAIGRMIANIKVSQFHQCVIVCFRFGKLISSESSYSTLLMEPMLY